MGRQPTTGILDDVERQQTPHKGDTEILDTNKAAWTLCIAMTAIVVIIACLYGPFLLFCLDANYYAAIDSVSAADLDPASRELSFNLTVGLTLWGWAAKSCFEPGTYAQLSYRGVPLAATDPAMGRLCGRRGKSVEQHVSVRVARVPVGVAMDCLALDVMQAAPVFDVTLHLPAGSYGVAGGGENCWVSRCRGSGAGAGAVWCDVPNK